MRINNSSTSWLPATSYNEFLHQGFANSCRLIKKSNNHHRLTSSGRYISLHLKSDLDDLDDLVCDVLTNFLRSFLVFDTGRRGQNQPWRPRRYISGLKCVNRY
ncbi:hypothetical protein ACMFMF_000398 [Clarireedia jacksonii]